MDINDFISFDGNQVLEGYKEHTVDIKPLDTSKLDEKAMNDLYDLFVSYFVRHSIGFRPSLFFGYDLYGVLGAWHYCYAINYIETFDADRAFAMDEANKNFFWKPPRIPWIPTKEHWKAPRMEGDNAALWGYGLLKESMRRGGEKPPQLPQLSVDELLTALDHVAEVRYHVQLGGKINGYTIWAGEAGGAALGKVFKAKMGAGMRALGVVGAVWGGADVVLGVMETRIHDELIRRIDADPNDDLDLDSFRSRMRQLGLEHAKLEVGAK